MVWWLCINGLYVVQMLTQINYFLVFPALDLFSAVAAIFGLLRWLTNLSVIKSSRCKLKPFGSHLINSASYWNYACFGKNFMLAFTVVNEMHILFLQNLQNDYTYNHFLALRFLDPISTDVFKLKTLNQ